MVTVLCPSAPALWRDLESQTLNFSVPASLTEEATFFLQLLAKGQSLRHRLTHCPLPLDSPDKAVCQGDLGAQPGAQEVACTAVCARGHLW